MRLHSLTDTSAIGSFRNVATGLIFAKIRPRCLKAAPRKFSIFWCHGAPGLRYRDCAHEILARTCGIEAIAALKTTRGPSVQALSPGQAISSVPRAGSNARGSQAVTC
jgi:hypothetical protein